MTVKLSALRVAPELDPSKYVAGASAVDAANENMAASAQRTGSTMDGAKGSVSRLGQTYVEGYSQQVKFEKGLNALDRALATGNATMAQAEAIIEGMSRRTGIMANADDLAALGKHELATAVTTVNAKLALEEAALDLSTAAQNRAAAASKSFAFQQRNLVFQLNDVFVSLAGGMNPMMVFMQQGSQIATIWGPEEGGVGRALGETGKMATGLVTKFWPIAAVAAAIGVGIGAMTTEINRNQKTQIGWTDVVVGAWELAAEGIMGFFQPVIETVGGWWEDAAPYVVGGVNNLIRTFDVAFANIATIFKALPNMLGDITISTANAVVGGIEMMINGAIGLINGMITTLNEKLGGIGINLGEIAGVDFAEFENKWAGSMGNTAQEFQQNYADRRDTNYVGAIGDRATDVHNRPTKEQLEEAEKAAERAADAYSKLLDKSNQRVEQLAQEAAATGLTDLAAMSLKNTYQLMAEAEATGMEMTPERVQQILTLSDAITDAELTLKGLQITLENRSPWEVMSEEVQNLNDLMAKGKITAEDYWTEVGKAAEEMVSGYASAADNLLGNIETITDAMGLEGKEAFDVQKALSIARAVVSGGEAIVNSYNAGTAVGGPVVGAVFAGVAAAAVAAQIASIASSTYDSSSVTDSTSGSASSGSTSTAGQSTASTGPAINITIKGSGKVDVEDLADELASAIADGGGQSLVNVMKVA